MGVTDGFSVNVMWCVSVGRDRLDRRSTAAAQTGPSQHCCSTDRAVAALSQHRLDRRSTVQAQTGPSRHCRSTDRAAAALPQHRLGRRSTVAPSVRLDGHHTERRSCSDFREKKRLQCSVEWTTLLHSESAVCRRRGDITSRRPHC